MAKKKSSRSSARRRGHWSARQETPAPSQIRPRENHSVHLLEYLTVPRILMGFAALLIVVVSFYLLSGGSRYEDMGVWARTAMARKKWVKALEYWEQLRQGPNRGDSPVIHYKMGRCLLELGQPDEALVHLEIALDNARYIENDPEAVSTLLVLHGWAFLQKENFERGVAEIEQALKRNPSHALGNLLLARHYLGRDNMAQASKHIQHLAGVEEHASLVEEFRRRIEKTYLDIPEIELADVPERVDLSPPSGAGVTVPNPMQLTP